MFAVGTLLAGKYQVDRVLGQGGMGVVIAATHVHLQQPVALKFLLPELVANPQIVERFIREARASAQLRGEHVCRVSDVGSFDNGAPYIVMELLDGRDLASLLEGNGPMPAHVATDYVLQACLGIAEAHALGIVHRDLKPANLFLTKRPDGASLIKVLDFGIAKAQGDRNFSLTQTSAILGSPGYMSPEQLRSTRSVDARSDIWSIGVILYELVSGQPPFRGESITELALHIAMDPTPPLVARTAALPPGFDAVVERCLAKDSNHRFADLAELAAALAPYGGPGSWEVAQAIARLLSARPRASAPVSAAMPTIAVPPTVPPTGPGVSRSTGPSVPTTIGGASGAMMAPAPASRRWIGITVGFVGVAAIAIVVAVVLSAKSGTPERPADPSSGGGDTAQGSAVKPPPPQPPRPDPTHAATTADAAVVMTPAVDAAAPPSVAIDAAVDAAAAPPDAGKKKTPRVPTTTNSTTKPEDFGESRF